MKFAAFYRNGAAMGFAPAQVRAMSLYEFACAYEGVRRSRSSEDEAAPLGATDLVALAGYVDAPPIWQ